MIALSVALICVGGLASGWAWQSTSTAQEVLTVRETVLRGALIEEDNLVRVRIGVDPAIKAVPAVEMATLVGQRAALDIVAHSVVTEGQVKDVVVPPKGFSVVGLSLTAAMLPTGNQLVAGDKVRVVTTTAGEGAAAATAPAAYGATVVRSSPDEITGNTLVNVQVATDVAPGVARRAAAGEVALVLDSQEQ